MTLLDGVDEIDSQPTAPAPAPTGKRKGKTKPVCGAQTAMVNGEIVAGGQACQLGEFHAGLHDWQTVPQVQMPAAPKRPIELNPRFHNCQRCSEPAVIRLPMGELGSLDLCGDCREKVSGGAATAEDGEPEGDDLDPDNLLLVGAEISGSDFEPSNEEAESEPPVDDEPEEHVDESHEVDEGDDSQVGVDAAEESFHEDEDSDPINAVAYFSNLPVLEAPVSVDPQERLTQLAARVVNENSTFQNAGRMALTAAFNIGQALAEAKVIVLKEREIGWESWLRDEAGVAERTAQRFMQWFNLASGRAIEDLPGDLGLIAAIDMLSSEKREKRTIEKQQRIIEHYILPPTCVIEAGDCAALPWPDQYIDLIFTSPPYGLGLFEFDDPEQHSEYLALLDPWCREMYRVLGAQGRLVLQVAIDVTKGETPRPLDLDWLNALERAGFSYRTRILWKEGTVKNAQARGSLDSPSAPHVFSTQEVLIVVHKGLWGLQEPDGKGGFKPRKGESEFQTEEGHAEWVEWLGGHGDWEISNQSSKGVGSFPDELARRVIQTFSFKGDIVGDPFAGWGTTPIMAASMNRTGVGVEKNPRRCAEANENAAKRFGSVRAVAE